MKKKWTYETCYKEAKKYSTRTEFQKGSASAYHVARRNKWLDDYTWFERLCKPNGYWNYETCYEEARKYNTRTQFQRICGRAYDVARKNKWLNDYTWFEEIQKPHNYWNYETCYEEALKYKTRKKFQKGCISAYTIAWKNKWLDDYTWFERPVVHNKKWTKEKCFEEAKKYNTRTEFRKGCGSAFVAAWKNKWLDDYYWMIDGNKLASLKRKKWTKEKCFEEAKKYNTRTDFNKGSKGAYMVAWKNKWLDEWFS